ncbi:MAG: flavodoxin, partial [Erysipelotrichia bacterium]|nr:flavodoxin [Erysipelotrichia bacterium]
ESEARRYYFGIVAKYGMQVQALLNKVKNLDIQIICSLHGPVLKENLAHYLNLYDLWSRYESEVDGVAIFFTSVYGHTKEAAYLIKQKLILNGTPKVVIYDLARSPMDTCVAAAFTYSKIVFATTTYNMTIFPFMNAFIDHLVERKFQNKEIALIENGSWAPVAAKVMQDKLAPLKNMTIVEPTVRLLSALDEKSIVQIDQLAKTLSADYHNRRNLTLDKRGEIDLKALYKIGYGLYVVTCHDGKKDNGLIVNTVTQLTDNPLKAAVTINKLCYSHEVIKKSGLLNVNTLNTDTPFSIFQKFGFVSGRNQNKFVESQLIRSDNGLVVLPQYINSFLSLRVDEYVDVGTHGIFICTVTESKIINNVDTMTYAYYQAHVKPKPNTAQKKGYVCIICGYIYEGEVLPEDFICPICKHGASDFEKIK